MKKSKWVGLGMASIWGLREDHPLYKAGATHDACQEALDILIKYYYDKYLVIPGYRDNTYKMAEDLISSIELPSKPSYYKKLVIHKMYELLNRFAQAPEVPLYDHLVLQKRIIKDFANDSDILFREMCYELDEDSLYESARNKLFYRLVRFWSFFKYKRK